jgi:hypothetical protein
MANPDLPDGVVNEQFIMHDADGSVTNDEDEAVSAEVIQTLDDGSVRRTIMTKASS